jgi:hypothetical protein
VNFVKGFALDERMARCGYCAPFAMRSDNDNNLPWPTVHRNSTNTLRVSPIRFPEHTRNIGAQHHPTKQKAPQDRNLAGLFFKLKRHPKSDACETFTATSCAC